MRTILSLILGGFLFFNSGIASVYTEEVAIDDVKTVFCVSPQGNPTDSGVFYFRNSFSLNEVPNKLLIDITADNKYTLFVNGKYVVRGSESGDLKNWFFDTVDIAPFLVKGKNVIAVSVVNYGISDHSPIAYMSRETSLWVQPKDRVFGFLDTNSKNWRVAKDKGIDFSAKTSFSLAGGSEVIDASKILRGWKSVDFDDTSWDRVVNVDRAGNIGIGSFHKRFLPRMLPCMEETPIRLGKVRSISGLAEKKNDDVNFIKGKPFEIPANASCKIVLDMGHLTNAYVDFNVSGGKNAVMKLNYCESFYDPKVAKQLREQGVRDSHMLSKGNRNEVAGKVPFTPIIDTYKFDGSQNMSFESVNFRSFRYVQIDVRTASEPLIINDFKGTFVGYPFKENAKFESSDASLKDIWNIAWRTARLCAFDTYYDCPFYERLQYVGDTRIQALISLYVSGDSRLMKKAITMFNVSRQDYGITQSRYPCKRTQYIPPFSLYWVNMVHDYYMHTPDIKFVESNLDGIETVLNWFVRKIDSKTGMLKQKIPFWNFVDWVRDWQKGIPPTSEKSGSAIISMHLASALDDASVLMERFGKDDIAKRYKSISSKIKKSVYENCWNQQRGILADAMGVERFSQHANIFGILTDTIPPSKQDDVLTKIIKQAKSSYGEHKADDIMEATFYFKFYLFKAMEKLGRGGEFLNMIQPWRDMISIGLTTFAENPEPTRSDCHAWSASPMYYFLSLVCGVKPASPEFKTVKIQPNLGSLDFVNATIMHPKGEIKVAFERGAKGVRSGKITLPEGVNGELVLGGSKIKLHSGEQTVSIKDKKSVRPVHAK